MVNKTLYNRTCIECHAQFIATEAPQKYCSAACRTITCSTCGEPFESYHKPRRKYCSRKCMGAAKRLSPDKGVAATTLRCSMCTTVKPVTEFHIHSKISRGYQYHCKSCQQNRPKAPSTPTDHRKWSLKTLYDLTLDQYNELYRKQDGLCGICGVHKDPWTPGAGQKGRWRSLVVDHNHFTNCVRGLLCVNCNIGLGHFKDSVDHLSAALDYLTESH